MAVYLTTNVEEIHIPQLLSLYQNEWWTKTRTSKEVKIMLANTTFVFGLVDDANNQLVAFTRVLSDGIFKAILFDVIVDPKYRGLGLGKRIVQEVINHSDLSKIESMELYCLPKHQSFYAALGFRVMHDKFNFMRLVKDGDSPAEP